MLVCTENTALRGVSRDKYSTRLRLVLYLSLDTPPRAVFSVQTRSGALSNIYAKQKHLGCKKVRGQSEATLQIGRRDQNV